jgi:hypothetical protein
MRFMPVSLIFGLMGAHLYLCWRCAGMKRIILMHRTGKNFSEILEPIYAMVCLCVTRKIFHITRTIDLAK